MTSGVCVVMLLISMLLLVLASVVVARTLHAENNISQDDLTVKAMLCW